MDSHNAWISFWGAGHRQGLELRVMTARSTFDLVRELERKCSTPGQFMLKAEETGPTSLDLRVVR